MSAAKDPRSEQMFHVKRVAELQNDIDNANFYGIIEISIRDGKPVIKKTIRTEEIK